MTGATTMFAGADEAGLKLLSPGKLAVAIYVPAVTVGKVQA